MEIERISRLRYATTIAAACLACALVVTAAAILGRATLNLRAAAIEKPDIAIYLLLPEEGIGKTELLREKEGERDYLAETKEGPKLIKLKKGEVEWYVSDIESLRE